MIKPEYDNNFMFKIKKQSNKARAGFLDLGNGKIPTPAFMPVATQAVAKHLSPLEVEKMGYKLILANTYHLLLRPGEKAVKLQGGLRNFMGWQGSVLTDSGGFQIFSLSKDRNKSGKSLVKLTPNGVEFKSYIDGSNHFLTPAKAFKIQADLGTSIAVCLDQCPALPTGKKDLESAVELTTRWAKDSKKAYEKMSGKKPKLFAVIQGGLDKELRLKSLKELTNIGFDGYNIGGLSVGEKPEQMYEVLKYLADSMPKDKPRYLMGVGYPENILEAVKQGVDMFDCVIPSREGRHGRLFFFKPNAKEKIKKALLSKKTGFSDFYSTININNNKYIKDKSCINKDSRFSELKILSKSYLHYLFQVNEPFGQRLATINNLEFYAKLMEMIRGEI